MSWLLGGSLLQGPQCEGWPHKLGCGVGEGRGQLPWSFQTFTAPSFDDKILEVVAVFGSMQMAVSRVIKLQHHRIAQVTPEVQGPGLTSAAFSVPLWLGPGASLENCPVYPGLPRLPPAVEVQFASSSAGSLVGKRNGV